MSVIPRQRGFGLIEAIVAASLVAAALLGLVSVVVATQEGEIVVAARAQREAALQNERARLVALPYWLPPSEAAEGETGEQLVCVLAEVFPHAAAGQASPAAAYLVSEGVGVFVSERRVGSVVVRREARFVCAAAGGRTEVRSANLQGWNVASSQEPPAARVLVALTATTGSAVSSLTASFGAASLVVSGEAP